MSKVNIAHSDTRKEKLLFHRCHQGTAGHTNLSLVVWAHVQVAEYCLCSYFVIQLLVCSAIVG